MDNYRVASKAEEVAAFGGSSARFDDELGDPTDYEKPTAFAVVDA